MTAPFTLLCRLDGRTALLSGNRLLEYYPSEPDAATMVGAVLLGRVERVLPDVKAAFVKIGQPKNGFLPLKEADSFHQAQPDRPLMSGQEILVQVKKEPKGEKGAFLTRDIALPGQYVLLMPQNRFVGVSKRVEDSRAQARARQLGRELTQNRFGVIVRHAALDARPGDVREETETLWSEWQRLEESSRCRKAPCVLRRDVSAVQMLQRDYAARHELFIQQEAEMGSQSMETAWKTANIETQLRQAVQRRVDLPEGGSLVIDEREALTTIDVNSGRVVLAGKGASLPLQENLAAVVEIARQIRLRNLSGMVLVDFIDMETDAQRRLVQEALAQALSDDRVKTVLHGFTSLGLMEITRKRTRESLRELLTQPCGACCETGRVWRG